jgi:hypothetical protein
MGTNYMQKILASTDMTASDVENAIQKQDVKLNSFGDKVVKLGFCEKKSQQFGHRDRRAEI